MALMHMTYSGCVNTFHNDSMSVRKPFNAEEYVKTNNKALKLTLNSAKSRRDIVNDINTAFSGIVKADFDKEGKFCRWIPEKSNVHIVFSPSMKRRFHLFHDVITPWDSTIANYTAFPDDIDEKAAENYIMIVPITHEHKKITIKAANETMSTKELMKRFNEEAANVLSLEFRQHAEVRLQLRKLHDDNILAVLSKPLKLKVYFYQSGIYGKGVVHYLSAINTGFKPSWELYLYKLSDIQNVGERMSIPITLTPRSFKYEKDAITYLNTMVKDANITFSLNEGNFLQMEIHEETTDITFSDTLRDILAFDQSSYSGRGTFFASGVLSLSRRIHYLYVYCNVSDYVRIGDTEAPLLAVIPFHPKCHSLLQEKTFKLPMYVPVIQNPISQIDIGIYDDAGQLVPFAGDSVTSIRLHFRKV